VATSYIWCGARPCQARNASNAVTRAYYAEGEFTPGSPAVSAYYAPDQIGSVRRVFTSASAPVYDYDPYGAPLQTTSPATDFGWAGMFNQADAGLYLTPARAYSPVLGRWLSRDPLGEDADPDGNLYVYVGGEPMSGADPSGLRGPWNLPIVEPPAPRRAPNPSPCPPGRPSGPNTANSNGGQLVVGYSLDSAVGVGITTTRGIAIGFAGNNFTSTPFTTTGTTTGLGGSVNGVVGYSDSLAALSGHSIGGATNPDGPVSYSLSLNPNGATSLVGFGPGWGAYATNTNTELGPTQIVGQSDPHVPYVSH
jgi:RHS repeat-associated protein